MITLPTRKDDEYESQYWYMLSPSGVIISRNIHRLNGYEMSITPIWRAHIVAILIERVYDYPRYTSFKGDGTLIRAESVKRCEVKGTSHTLI
jgi:hypothetical protein